MIYLDYAATTPLETRALEAYIQAATELGNAASVHWAGRHARERIEHARSQIAEKLGIHPLEVVFNTGGTEGNNHVLLGLALERGSGHIVSTSIEHSAILQPLSWLQRRGIEVSFLTPDRWGRIDPEALSGLLREDTFLVSIGHTNNELGSVQDIRRCVEIAHAHGVLVHSDMVQSLGVLPIHLTDWQVDFASFSGHKCYGPKGTGFLYVRRDVSLPPMMLGGHQERGLRGGTQNVPGICALGVAVDIAVSEQQQTHAHLSNLKSTFVQELGRHPNIAFNHPSDGNPKVVSVTVHGVDGEALWMNLDLEGVAASAGSACSAGTMQPSHVLLALGLSQTEAKCSVRFSFGRTSSLQEIKNAADAFGIAISRSVI